VHSFWTCLPPVVLPPVSIATQMYRNFETQFSSLKANLDPFKSTAKQFSFPPKLSGCPESHLKE